MGLRKDNPNTKRMAPGGAYMVSPPQGLSIIGTAAGKTAGPAPVGHIVKLASGRAAIDAKAIKTQKGKPKVR